MRVALYGSAGKVGSLLLPALHAEGYEVVDARVDGVVGLDVPAARHERHRRAAADERPPAPALAVLDRLEQEAGLVTDQLDERRDRRLEIAEHLGPHGDDGVLGGEPVELLARRLDVHR